MIRELSWEDLVEELERVKTLGPLEAIWFATRGREDSGIWRLGPKGEERLASFSLFAAHVIAKLGIAPAAIPEPQEYCPYWQEMCEADQELARNQGKSLDLSDAIPSGLGKIDDDAVDPCTRAWLELLRQEGVGFRIATKGTVSVKGTQYETVSGTIEDVCTASRVYLKRRTRDEIANQLVATRGKTLAYKKLSRRAPKEIVDAAKRREHCSYEALASRIGIGKDTLYAITGETRWVSDDSYGLVAKRCGSSPEDLHPRNIPPPRRRQHRR